MRLARVLSAIPGALIGGTIMVAPSLLPALQPATPAIPIHQVGPVEARSRDTVNALFGVRELSDGRLLANDAGARRLLLFDASLTAFKLVADTTSGTSTPYGTRATAIMPFTGDSTLLVDTYTRAFIVIAPNGAMARTIAAPRANDVAWLANQSYGVAGIDPKGRLVYRAFPRYKERPDSLPPGAPLQLDSAPIIRADFDTRNADTVALLGVPNRRMASQSMPDGRRMMQLVVNPLPLIDDWSLLPDGTVAVLRGQDYHLDWVSADGARSSTPKMPFDWKRLTDADKQAIIDSTKQVVERQWKESQSTAASGGAPANGTTATAGVTSFGGGGGGGGGGSGGGFGAPASTGLPIKRPMPEVAKPSELPDYIPPVLQSGTMRVDPAGNLWILPSTSLQSAGGFLYDVINRKGEIIERVRIPAGRVLVGFGAHGVVYLTARDATGSWLERARLVSVP